MLRPQLSVIIPAYNEESRLPRTLRHVLAYLSSKPYHSEVLVVDDGSTDGTAEVVERLSGQEAMLHLERHPDHANHGKGAAVKLGMLAARGEFRLFMDADNSTTVEQIEGFWPRFEEGCDVVVGSRAVAGAIVPVRQPKYREMAGRFGNWIIRACAVPGILDTQVGFKMFTRGGAEMIFPRVTIERWGFDIEVLAIARLHKLRICEVPIRWCNAPGSKVGMGSYLEVLSEVWRIRRNMKAGLYV
ncbi:MAG: glycosyltransferase family 2 protein [Acidobacteria bacterium]|nr:glycosyltransferase family 2 protein [Acidobacteriota bacterium]